MLVYSQMAQEPSSLQLRRSHNAPSIFDTEKPSSHQRSMSMLSTTPRTPVRQYFEAEKPLAVQTHSRSFSAELDSEKRKRLQKSPKSITTPPRQSTWPEPNPQPRSSWYRHNMPARRSLPPESSPPSRHPALMGTEERLRRIARVNETRLELARREQRFQAQTFDGERWTEPMLAEYGDSWIMDRPRRGATASKKGFRFYYDAITNFKNRKA